MDLSICCLFREKVLKLVSRKIPRLSFEKKCWVWFEKRSSILLDFSKKRGKSAPSWWCSPVPLPSSRKKKDFSFFKDLRCIVTSQGFLENFQSFQHKVPTAKSPHTKPTLLPPTVYVHLIGIYKLWFPDKTIDNEKIIDFKKRKKVFDLWGKMLTFWEKVFDLKKNLSCCALGLVMALESSKKWPFLASFKCSYINDFWS